MRVHGTTAAMWVVACAQLLVRTAFGADLSPGTTEIAGFGGGIHARGGGGSATKGIGGGGFGVAAHKNVWVTGEFGYVPLGSFGIGVLAVPGVGTVTSSASAKLYGFDGGLQLNIPTGSAKASPYVAIGAGVGRFSGSGSATVRVGAQTSTIRFDESSSEFGAGGGFGLRYYAGANWGIRPEVRVVRYFADPGITVMRFSFGIFYQFRR